MPPFDDHRGQAPGLGATRTSDSTPRSPAFLRKARGRRPSGLHSPWQLLEHLRIAQHDILDFCRNPNYKEMRWPADYWPPAPAPPSDRRVGRRHPAVPRRTGRPFNSIAADPKIDLERAHSARRRADVPPGAAADRGSLRLSRRAAGPRPPIARRVEAAVTAAPRIAVSGLTKIYGTTTAVDGLNALRVE